MTIKVPKYRVRISRNGSQAYRYFDTLDDALAYEHPQEYDPFGYPRKGKPRITIQENVNGVQNKYKNVDGLATIHIGGRKIQVRL